MRDKFGRGPTVVSKKGSLNFNNRLGTAFVLHPYLTGNEMQIYVPTMSKAGSCFYVDGRRLFTNLVNDEIMHLLQIQTNAVRMNMKRKEYQIRIDMTVNNIHAAKRKWELQ